MPEPLTRWAQPQMPQTVTVQRSDLLSLYEDRLRLRDLLQDLQQRRDQLIQDAAQDRALAEGAQTVTYKTMNRALAEVREHEGRMIGILLQAYRPT